MFEPILTPQDPRVADYRGVSEPGLLRSRNLFVAEGRMVLKRLIEDGRWTVRSVLVSVDGQTVVKYYRNRTPADYAHVWSVTKSDPQHLGRHCCG